MPLAPLQEPAFFKRVTGIVIGSLIALVLFSSIISFNGLQTLSLILRPFSEPAFRGFNRWAANTWWSWTVVFARFLHGVEIIRSGDNPPPRENAAVLANHQQMTDIPVLFTLAREKGRLGDLKWVVKDIVKYVPGIGWGMVFIDCVFVKRNWATDREHLRRVLNKFYTHHIPIWLVSFAEGTRLTTSKLAQSQEYAREKGIKPLRHLLMPRTKGFMTMIPELRGHLDAVYDIVIGYEEGVPSIWQWTKGYAKRVHMHVRRYPIAALPEGETELAEWLLTRWREKDDLLERYYATGAFG
jgi:1-acyl-sn-glycerol-3-phosphate acyltransferase